MADEPETVTRSADPEEKDPAEKAKEVAESREKAAEQVKSLEDDPPKDLKDWPSDEGKYITFGGADGGYEDGPTKNLGPSELRHHEDGSVTIGGEKVDDPDEYKGEPIPGGPTDPNAVGGPEESASEADGDGDGKA